MTKSKKTAKVGEILSFENSLTELESIVKTLEKGEQSLEETLQLFESGVKLYKTCQKELSQAEHRVKILTDKLKEEDF